MNLRAEAAVEEAAPDTLLESLMVLTRLAQRALSAEALRAGLPLEGGRLTVDLVPRAAARAGLLARVVTRKLEKLPGSALPAILLLNDGNACVLASVDEAGTADFDRAEATGSPLTLTPRVPPTFSERTLPLDLRVVDWRN